MPTLSALHNYLRQHPHYWGSFLRDLCLIWWWRLRRQPIVVLTTESGGLGDYIWFRSYYSAIREHYSPKLCRIVAVGMCQWEPLAYGLDESRQENHFDIYRAIESPDRPLKIESLFFRLFRADVYVDFRARHLKHLVRADKCFFGLGFRDAKQYYESANNAVIERWFMLPESFRHKPPLLPIADDGRGEALKRPYAIVVEGGNTQGKLSDTQTLAVVEHILSRGYNIFFNGDFNKLPSIHSTHLIDGYTYPLNEYPTIVAQSEFVVTVNTFVYHLAIQLNKPCVVISANEYESIKLDAASQVVVFNEELQQAYENNKLHSYRPNSSVGLNDIACERIIEAIDSFL